MTRILLLLSLLAVPLVGRAGNLPIDQRDCDLIPGDFGKPVVISLVPGVFADPWMINDPDIIIDEDGPSEDDQGLIYIGTTANRGWVRPPVRHVGLDD